MEYGLHAHSGLSGPQAIRFTVTVTPSGFERFFQDIERRRLLTSDVAELSAVADDVGMDILGPPLSDEEVVRSLPKQRSRRSYAGNTTSFNSESSSMLPILRRISSPLMSLGSRASR